MSSDPAIALQSQLTPMALLRAGVNQKLPGKFLKSKHSVLLIGETSTDLAVWHAVGKANICYQSESGKRWNTIPQEVDSEETKAGSLNFPQERAFWPC